MKSGKIYAISIVAIVVVLITLFVFVLSPTKYSNEIYVREGNNYWDLDDGQTVYGKSTWAIFADAWGQTTSRRETIKLYDCIYWGAILYDTDAMSWENETGYVSNSLTLNDLISRWQDNASVFKFKYGDNNYRVSFSIPKLENGTNKYADLNEAWDKGELYQTIEKW